MRNIFGFNIQFADTADRQECLARLEKYKPAWNLTYSVTDADDIQEKTGGKVAVRLYEDGGVNEKHDLAWIVNKYKNVAAKGHWVELTNEYTDIQWLKEILLGKDGKPGLLAMGWKVLAPAFSSGTPKEWDWPTLRFLFECYRDYPNTFRISVHEYMTSTPFNLIAGSEWTPDTQELPDISMWWHNGRFERFAFAYCDANNLPRPKYVITEAGRANQNGERNSTFFTGGWTNGWRSLIGWYEKRFPGLTGARVFCKMNTWLVDKFYNRPGSLCEGYILFNYDDNRNLPKNSWADWAAFCVARDVDFWDEYDRWYNNLGDVIVIPVPDTNIVWYDTFITPSGTKPSLIRSAPVIQNELSNVIGAFPLGRNVAYIDPVGTEKKTDGTWLHVSYNGVIGYTRSDVVILEKGNPPPIEVTPVVGNDLNDIRLLVEKLEDELGF